MDGDAQLVSSKFPGGVRLGSDQETFLATESPSPCSSSEMQQWPQMRVLDHVEKVHYGLSDGRIFEYRALHL